MCLIYILLKTQVFVSVSNGFVKKNIYIYNALLLRHISYKKNSNRGHRNKETRAVPH